jgi:hypothetical protein
MVIRKTMYWIIGIFLFCGWAELVWGQTERWSDESITLATTLTTLSVLDAKQTFHMEEYRMYYDKIEPITYAHEVNPFIGKSPTKDRVVLVKVLSGTLTFYGLNKMKEKNRKKALTYLNVFYFIVVLHNASLGLMS